MDFKKIIEDQRAEFSGRMRESRIIEREVAEGVKKYLQHPNIVAILGVRRCGKSVLSWQVFSHSDFGYVDFSDERLEGLKAKDMNDVLLSLYSLHRKNLKNIILDEVHEVKGWERFVSRLRTRHRIIITGSNSKMLSGELSTYLTGRHMRFALFPFSLREVLRYRGAAYEKTLTTREQSEVVSILDDYMKNGGFPERFLFGRAIVRQTYEDIVIKDVVLRADVKKQENIRRLARYLVSNASSEFTYKSLKSVAGINRSATISYWTSLLEDAFLVFKLERFSPKLKEQILAPKKIYCVDNGIANAISFKISEDKGRLMENLVAVELLRRRNYWSSDLELFYFRDHQQHEVDFVMKEGLKVKRLIQVSYISGKDEIERRELRALVKASGLLKCKDLLCITWGYEAEEEFKGKRIKFLPLWKWLLLQNLAP